MPGCFDRLSRHTASLISRPDLEILFCGPCEAGKTSLIKRLAGHPLELNTIPTGPAAKKRLYLEDCLVECIEYGGQPRYHPSLFSSIHNTDVIVFVLDYMEYLLHNQHPVRCADFQATKLFLKRVIMSSYVSQTPLLVVGTKLDLVVQKYQSQTEGNATIGALDALSSGSNMKNTSLPRTKSRSSIGSKPLLSKQTVQHSLTPNSSRKKLAQFLQTLFSLSQLANDLDIHSGNDDEEIYMELTRQDLKDPAIFLLAIKLGFIEPVHSVEDVDRGFKKMIALERDFGIILVDLKGGLEEIIDWLINGEGPL